MSNTSGERIFKSITCESFRGSQGRSTLDLYQGLPKEDKSPPVTFIFGENGSGKSTYCDALEYAARNASSRRYTQGRKQAKKLQYLRGESPPSVSAVLSDGSMVQRGSGSRSTIRGIDPTLGFGLAPVALRRDVVELFWKTPQELRLHIFWDYLTPGPHGWRSPHDERLLEDWRETRKRLDSAGASIRTIIPPDYIIPGQSGPYRLPVRDVAIERLPGVLRHVSRHRGLDFNDAHIGKIAKEYSRAVTEERDAKKFAAEAKQRTPWGSKPIRSILENARARISEDFLSISGFNWICDVEFRFGADDSSAEFDVYLIDDEGNDYNPLDILSEAYLDVLALIILIEVHIGCAEVGQGKFLILDDVFQSVDGPLRRRCLASLLPRLNDWQLVLTVHDRAWLQIAKQLVDGSRSSKAAVVEVRRQSDSDTPVVLEGAIGPVRDVEFVRLNGGSPVLLAGACGRAVEALLDHLTLKFHVKMARKEFYMIQDLLNAADTELKNCSLPLVRDAGRTIKNAQFLRNSFGAHFSFDAETIAYNEVDDVAKAVIVLWGQLMCMTCGVFCTKEDAGSGKWSPKFTCKCQ